MAGTGCVRRTQAVHAAAILSAAGASLTTLETWDNVTAQVRDAITRLSGLQRLALSGQGAGAAAADCRALKVRLNSDAPGGLLAARNPSSTASVHTAHHHLLRLNSGNAGKGL